MSSHANLSPHSAVPVSGTYRGMCCGEGGIADSISQILGNTGGLPGAANLRSKAFQHTSRYFEAGRLFPECPNCGPGTGWTLLEEGAPDETATHGTVIEDSRVCDVCNRRVNSPDGYLLTTEQVVRTPNYWRHYYETHKTELLQQGIADFEAFRRHPIAIDCAKAMASQATNWLVCDTCLPLFNINSAGARQLAIQWGASGKTFNPPGTGAVRLNVADMGLGPMIAMEAMDNAVASAKLQAAIHRAEADVLKLKADKSALRGMWSNLKWSLTGARAQKDAERRLHAAVREMAGIDPENLSRLIEDMSKYEKLAPIIPRYL